MTARRPGLTLLELIVVLAILAILAGVASVATEGVIEQTRHDASRRALDDVRTAVVGPEDVESGTAGFIAHMGRVPDSLDELLTFPHPAGTHSIDTDGDAVTDAHVLSGWRGPYLRLPPGVPTVRDAWGRDLTFQSGAAGLTVQTLGADGAVGQSGDVFTSDVLLAIPPDDYTGSVTFQVREIVTVGGVTSESTPVLGGGSVHVRVWRVQVTTGGATAVPSDTIASPPGYATTWTGLAGPIVVRAVATNGKTSDVLYHTVGARTTAVKKLILR